MGLKYHYHLAFQIRKIEVTLGYELTPDIRKDLYVGQLA